MNKHLALLSLFLFCSSAMANPKNPLLGKWRWFSKSCKNPDLIFESTKVTQVSDVDGEIAKKVFKKVSYKIEKETVHVNFGEQHGWGGVQNDTELSFSFKNPNHAVVVRPTAPTKEKPSESAPPAPTSLDDLHRCKSK